MSNVLMMHNLIEQISASQHYNLQYEKWIFILDLLNITFHSVIKLLRFLRFLH